MSENPAPGRRTLAAALVLILATALEAREIEIRGRIVDGGGRPLAEAEVALHPVIGSAEAGRLQLAKRYPPPAEVRTRSADDGAFRLLAPGPGLWRLVVARPGYAPLVNALQPLLAPASFGEVALPRAQDQTVRVVDGKGRGVARMRLTVWGDFPRWRAAQAAGWYLDERSVVTGDDGQAAIPRAERERLFVAGTNATSFVYAEIDAHHRGDVELVARPLTPARVVDAEGRPAAGVVGFFQRPYHAFGRSGAEGELRLPWEDGDSPRLVFADEEGALAGGVRRGEDGVVVRLRRPPAVTGSVVDETTGAGVAGALVWTQGAHVEADREGGFVLRPGPDGQLTAAQPGYLPASLPGAEGEVTLRLRPAVSRRGRVVDSEGRGLAGASVSAAPDPRWVMDRPGGYSIWRQRLPGAVTAGTDADGRFELHGLSPKAPYWLSARRSGFAPARITIEAAVADEGDAELRLVLEPGAVAFGTVLDPERDPLAGAQAQLIGGGPVRPSESDARGRFTFADFSPGTYSLRVWADGYAVLEMPGLEIGLGEPVDLGAVILEPALKLSGRVVDGEGNPVAGAQLHVLNLDHRRSGPGASATSDVQGEFELGNLSPSQSVLLTVDHERYRSLSISIVVREHGEPLELVLKPGVALGGRVVDSTGRPAAGARITVARSVGVGTSSMSAEIGEGGRFRFSGQDPGKVTVRAQSPLGFSEPREIVLEAGREHDVEIVLRPGATLTGRVSDGDGRAVELAQIWLRRDRPRGAESSPPTLGRFGKNQEFSDGAGDFSFQGLEPGQYRLWVDHPEFEPVEKAVELAEGASLHVELDLGARLAPATVRGRVVDPTGQGIGDATVWYQVTGDRRSDFVGTRSIASDPTSPDGSFHLQVPRPGTYTLQARHRELVPGGEVEVEVAAGGLEGVVLQLARGGAVSGRIVGGEPDDVIRMRVWARNEEAEARSGYANGVVSSDGTYRIDGLVAGPWTVHAQIGISGRVAHGDAVVGGPGDEAHLDLEFPRGYRLQGVVLLDAEPLAGAAVAVACENVHMGQARTGLDGAFAIEGVPSGPCQLRAVVEASSALRASRELEVTGDEDVAIEIETASLAGTVLDAATGLPLPGATLELFFEEPGGGQRATDSTATGAGGRFAFPRLAAGSWMVHATAEGHARKERAVTVIGHVEVEPILLEPTTPLVLEIRTASGAVPYRVTVTLKDEGGRAVVQRQSYQPDHRGYLELGHVPPGRYRLLVESAGEKAELDVEHPSADVVPVVLGGPGSD